MDPYIKGAVVQQNTGFMDLDHKRMAFNVKKKSSNYFLVFPYKTKQDPPVSAIFPVMFPSLTWLHCRPIKWSPTISILCQNTVTYVISFCAEISTRLYTPCPGFVPCDFPTRGKKVCKEFLLIINPLMTEISIKLKFVLPACPIYIHNTHTHTRTRERTRAHTHKQK